MRDIPMFPTDHGVASLALGQIPYRREAYITVQTALPGEAAALVAECAAFCRMAGAEKIYARGEGLEGFPVHTALWTMRGTAWVDREKLESLFPVTSATAPRWREVYNRRMAGVDLAALLEERDEARLLTGAYFVHHQGTLLGIGWLEDTRLLAMASAKPGAGERVMHSLMSLVEGADMTLEVASTNTRATELYRRLGFLPTEEKERWHEVMWSYEI